MAVFARAKVYQNKGITYADKQAPICDRCKEPCVRPKVVDRVPVCKRCVKQARTQAR